MKRVRCGKAEAGGRAAAVVVADGQVVEAVVAGARAATAEAAVVVDGAAITSPADSARALGRPRFQLMHRNLVTYVETH